MQSLRRNVMEVLRASVDTLLPPRCVITGDLVEQQGMISPKAWAQLNFITDPKCQSCGIPFDFEVEGASFCTSCLSHPPNYDTTRSALRYDDQSRDLVLRFKHADQTHVVQAFLPWLKNAGGMTLAKADALIPVPLHYWRLLRRRYNQASLMARALGEEMDMPCMLDVLRRTRATVTQGHLSAKERYKNVRRAFSVHPERLESVRGKTLVLIDDVYTTGATVNECSKALKQAGAQAVHVLTLARVVRPGSV